MKIIDLDEGWFDSKPKVDWNKRAKELFAKGMTEQQVAQQLTKEGCPPNQVNVYVQAGQLQEMPIEPTDDPNDPVIYGHEKANPMSLKGRIMSARAQLKELAQAAESNDLSVWQDICAKAKGGMFMGLEQNLEQIRHGIEELVAKRRKGGIASRGISKNISEKAPPTAKAERMVKHIKKGYAKDGKLSDKEKSIAYATAWKAHNAGKVEEAKGPCWKGYQQIGMKKKGGRQVPNCVPKK